MQYVDSADAVIANGGTTSTAIPLRGERLLIGAVDLPTLTSCDLEIEGSLDGGTTYRNINDAAGQILKLTATTGGIIWATAADAAKVLGLTHIRFVSSAAQGAARTLRVSFLR